MFDEGPTTDHEDPSSPVLRHSSGIHRPPRQPALGAHQAAREGVLRQRSEPASIAGCGRSHSRYAAQGYRRRCKRARRRCGQSIQGRVAPGRVREPFPARVGTLPAGRRGRREHLRGLRRAGSRPAGAGRPRGHHRPDRHRHRLHLSRVLRRPDAGQRPGQPVRLREPPRHLPAVCISRYEVLPADPAQRGRPRRRRRRPTSPSSCTTPTTWPTPTATSSSPPPTWR